MIERIGEGLEVLRIRRDGEWPANIFLLADDGGACVYETGSVGMADEIREAADARGGITRIVLSHAHADHRGGASRLDAPVFCHPAERELAEGDGGLAETLDFSKVVYPEIRANGADAFRRLDGGPLEIEGTLSAGKTVAGFEVIHLPGHTPGQIGLWRESDRLAIVSDAAFVFNPFSPDGERDGLRLPPPVVRPDDAAARETLRRVADLDPATLWLGHYAPITDNPAEQLERAAEGP